MWAWDFSCPCVTDVGVAVTNLRVVCKIVTCVSAFTEMASEMAKLIFLEIVKSQRDKSCCRSGHSALQATRRMPLWALAFALSTGKNTRLFGLLDQNETWFFYLRVCVTAQRARQPMSRRAISLGSFTVAGDFMLQVIRLESLGSELQES